MSHRPQLGKHYLITGGAGFVGSHLCEALLDRGESVTVIDNLSTGRFQNIRHLVEKHGRGPRSRFRFAIDTIANEPVLDRLASGCDTIIHLAAAVGVRLILDKPVQTIETNVMGTEFVLKAAHRYRCKVMLASTSEVYGKSDRIPFREDDDITLGPTSRSRWSYAASKLVDEFLALAYHREKSLPVVIFRLFNTVGPRQTGRYGMVIPRFVGQALRGEPLTVYGDGQQSRCFIHVKDAVAGILALDGCPDAIGQVYNIGSSKDFSISELALRVLGAVRGGEDFDRERDISYIPYQEAFEAGFEDMRKRKPDVAKITSETGWKPEFCLEDVLSDVAREIRQGRSEGRALDLRSDPRT